MDVALSKNGARLLRAFFCFVVIFLYAPIVILLIFSFNDSAVPSFPLSGFTTHWYTLAWQDTLLRQSLINSTTVALVVTPCCLVLGTLTAFGLTRFRFRGRGVVGGLVGAPLILPWLIIGIAALMAYGRLHIALNLRSVIATALVT